MERDKYAIKQYKKRIRQIHYSMGFIACVCGLVILYSIKLLTMFNDMAIFKNLDMILLFILFYLIHDFLFFNLLFQLHKEERKYSVFLSLAQERLEKLERSNNDNDK